MLKFMRGICFAGHPAGILQLRRSAFLKETRSLGFIVSFGWLVLLVMIAKLKGNLHDTFCLLFQFNVFPSQLMSGKAGVPHLAGSALATVTSEIGKDHVC